MSYQTYAESAALEDVCNNQRFSRAVICDRRLLPGGNWREGVAQNTVVASAFAQLKVPLWFDDACCLTIAIACARRKAMPHEPQTLTIVALPR